METLKKEFYNEIKETLSYFDDDDNEFTFTPIDNRENRIFDSGYIEGFKQALRILERYKIK